MLHVRIWCFLRRWLSGLRNHTVTLGDQGSIPASDRFPILPHLSLSTHFYAVLSQLKAQKPIWKYIFKKDSDVWGGGIRCVWNRVYEIGDEGREEKAAARCPVSVLITVLMHTIVSRKINKQSFSLITVPGTVVKYLGYVFCVHLIWTCFVRDHTASLQSLRGC